MAKSDTLDTSTLIAIGSMNTNESDIPKQSIITPENEFIDLINEFIDLINEYITNNKSKSYSQKERSDTRAFHLGGALALEVALEEFNRLFTSDKRGNNK